MRAPWPCLAAWAHRCHALSRCDQQPSSCASAGHRVSSSTPLPPITVLACMISVAPIATAPWDRQPQTTFLPWNLSCRLLRVHSILWQHLICTYMKREEKKKSVLACVVSALWIEDLALPLHAIQFAAQAAQPLLLTARPCTRYTSTDSNTFRNRILQRGWTCRIQTCIQARIMTREFE
jgi:hypothetical protein